MLGRWIKSISSGKSVIVCRYLQLAFFSWDGEFCTIEALCFRSQPECAAFVSLPCLSNIQRNVTLQMFIQYGLCVLYFVFYASCFMLYFTSHLLKLAYTELCKRLRLEPFSHSISWRVSFVPNLLTEPPETLEYLRIIVMSEKNLKLDCKRHLALSHIFSLAPISL